MPWLGAAVVVAIRVMMGQGKSLRLCALIMRLAARRSCDVLWKRVNGKAKPGPCVGDVRFLPAGVKPSSPLCKAMVISRGATKNDHESAVVQFAVPNVPGKFSVGAAFAALWGDASPPCRYDCFPLLPNNDVEDLSYRVFLAAFQAVARALHWPKGMQYTHCMRVTTTTVAAKAGLPDHQLMLIGDWHSGAYKAYVKPGMEDKAELLRRFVPRV